MKNTLLLLLLFTGMMNGQIVNIPDANFKAKLISLGIDTDSDGEIQIIEAENVTSLNIDNAGITSLEGLNAFINLESLECENNLFSILDISQLSNLSILYTGFNPNLTFLLLKNGLIDFNIPPPPPAPPGFGGANFSNCPNLQYVCVGDGKLQDGLLYLDYFYSTSAITLNSYCSSIPGGNYNTITGNVLYDFNNDGCDASDFANPYSKLNINDGTNSGSSFTNATGNYTFYTENGNFTITPEVENPSYFSISPTSAIVNFPLLDNSTQTQNFCVSANGFHPDLEVIITPFGVARPGFDSEYKLVFKNKGNQNQSGTINLTFDDVRTDFVSATPTINSQIGNNLLWNFSNLQPFETRVINLTLNINSPLETPAVNNGDILNFIAIINPIESDETPLDNAFNFNQTVVNSYDPNDKSCLEGNVISPEDIGKYVHYNINFENIGTADAVNVVIKDIIDTTMFEMNSLQLLYASHPVETKIDGNKVEFIFKNIYLPPSNIDPIGGHGNVLFKLKTLPTLLVGDQIANIANIYFDYNAPIETNEARSTFAALNNSNFVKDQSIIVAPNPAKNSVTVNAKNNIKSMQLFDVQGRILQTILENTTTSTIDISNKSNGIYFLKVTTEIGSKVEKLVKEN